MAYATKKNTKAKKAFKTNDEKIGSHANHFNAKFIAYVEKNKKLPWERDWNTSGSDDFLDQRNACTQRPYNYFLNQIYLSMEAEANGWGNQWITKNGIEKNGGTFKGSPTWIYGWFYWEQVQTNEKGEVLKDSKGKDVKKSGYNFKTYRVWNTDQCEGLPTKLQSTDEEDAVEYTPLEGRVDNAEEYISNIGANVTFGGDRAYYRPSTDTIGMPTFESFKTVEGYYSTFTHELIHWTKTEDRCKRKDNHASRKAYAFEELIAEMGAVYTMHNLGIKMDKRAFDNHCAYVDSWMKALDKDTRFIIDASMQADRAVKFLNKTSNENGTSKLLNKLEGELKKKVA